MPVSKKQQACVNRYNAKNYDRVNLMMPRGEKETAQSHAQQFGESLNGFINRAIREAMERDGRAGAEPMPPETLPSPG